MAIRADSFSSTSEVKAFTRHLINVAGATTFNSTTRPTLTEVERFIDRASGVLNSALWKGGFNPSRVKANTTATLSCDDWVTYRTVAYAELTQRGEGFSQNEGSRSGAFIGLLYKEADEFVKSVSLGFKNMGVTVAVPASRGLIFTGLSAQAERSDPSDAALEQPIFTRRGFDEPDTRNDREIDET